MWADAQRDGRPAEYRWRHVLNAAKFGSRPLLECRAVTLPIGERKTWRTQTEFCTCMAKFRYGATAAKSVCIAVSYTHLTLPTILRV